MKLSDFYYELPERLIAQHPLKERSSSRLLVLNRANRSISHGTFCDILDYMEKGDCLVLNDTRVIPARLIGEREDSGGKIEFVLLNRRADLEWEIIVKPGRRAKVGNRFVFGGGELRAEILDIVNDGNRIVRFEYEGIFEQVLDKLGEMPLPPYITEKLEDRERYQTVYSKHEGSAAAPTAGLHFTPELLGRIEEKGIDIAYITLHVGLGTFRSVKEEDIEKHNMHSEFYSVSEEAARTINDAKRVIAVGTTTTRTLETITDGGKVKKLTGWTNIFIYPPYKFKQVDCMITNFHLPESTLIMLVSAFADRELILEAYNEAVKEEYRFFSFGDAMIII